MKNLLSLLFIGLLTTSVLSAQSPADIFQYSQRSYSGTARSLALGGAQTSLGADFGSLSINPAGIGLYRSSELSLSVGLDNTNSTSSGLATESEGRDTGFAFGGAGLVLTNHPRKRKQEKGWKFVNFGVGINRIYNNDREYNSGGFNDANSITDFFAENANGLSEAQLFDTGLYDYSALAYRAYLIDPTAEDNVYTSILNSGQVQQEERILRSGGKSELLVNYGLNLNDKYYFGASLGIVTANLNKSVFFSESDEFGNHANFDFLELTERVNTTGSGLNVSIGAIARLTDQIRVGASIKSPTRMSVTETFSTELRARAVGANGMETFNESSPDGFFEYDYNEPYRFNAGISYFIKKKALFSFDYGLVDYSTMRVHYSEDAFSDNEEAVNQGIKTLYKAAHTYRFGVEGNLRAGLYARIGTSSTNSPFVNDERLGAVSTFAGGLGYRNEKYFFDLSFNRINQEVDREPYAIASSDAPVYEVSDIETNLMLTMGTRF